MSENTPYYTYKQFMIDTCGEPIHRVSLDLGFGCPNRESDGTGGCSFCPSDGSRAKNTLDSVALEDQIRTGVEFARERYRAKKLMAYIQAFTGTFAPASEQREIYMNLLNSFQFDALTIGTRPDCLPAETLEFLCELSQKIDLWIELGVQTVHDKTLERINRGHGWEESRQAILSLNEAGIKTAVHVILGLPGETSDDFNDTAETLACLPIKGIKIHNLHVMKGTALEDEYASNSFKVFDEHEYAEVLIGFLRRLPPGLPIIRINTDTPRAELVAPLWNMDKNQFRSYVIKLMNARGHKQGDLCVDI